MIDPTTALTTAIENSAKVANTPLFSTVIDKLLGFKISEWKAQGDVIKKQILDGYEEAKAKGMGTQYVSVFRSNTNLINIGVRAAEYIDDSKPNEIRFENDFFWGMIEHAKEISNEEMQELIAKIIAGEYNRPGSYSMSTLQSIKMLGKEELELFETIACLLINGESIPKNIFSLPDNAKDFLGELKIDFGSLQILQNLGIFLPNDMTRSIENSLKQKFLLQYFDHRIIFEPTHENNFIIKLPDFYALSTTGRQIVKHLNPKFSNKYFSWLKENYKIPNYKIIE